MSQGIKTIMFTALLVPFYLVNYKRQFRQRTVVWNTYALFMEHFHTSSIIVGLYIFLTKNNENIL